MCSSDLGKEGACRPAGCLLGGEARLAVPLAWPRRQPGTCRECNRRRRRFVVNIVFAGCTPGRTLVGLRLPGEGNNQPQRRRVRCTSARARRKIVHRKHPPTTDHPGRTATGGNPSERTTPPEPHGEVSHRVPEPILAAKFHPHRSSQPEPRGCFTSSVRPEPRDKISHGAPDPSLAGIFHTKHPTRTPGGNLASGTQPEPRGDIFLPCARLAPQGEISHQAPGLSLAALFHAKRPTRTSGRIFASDTRPQPRGDIFPPNTRLAPRGEFSHQAPGPSLAGIFHTEPPARTSGRNLASGTRPEPRGAISC